MMFHLWEASPSGRRASQSTVSQKIGDDQEAEPKEADRKYSNHPQLTVFLNEGKGVGKDVAE